MHHAKRVIFSHVSEHRNILTVNALGKPVLKVIVNTKDNSLTIHSLQYPRISASIKWITKSKTIQMTLKTLKNRMMINLRTGKLNKALFFDKTLTRTGKKITYTLF